MKTKLTQFFKGCAIAVSVLYGSVAYAATFTAVSSGSWSSTATWSGGLAPGASIGGVDNVVINSGVTVTMDMSVTVSSLISSIQVNGTLNSTGSYMLDINSGSLSGNGTLNLAHLRFGTLGSMSFTGTAHIDHMHNNNASLSLVSQLYLNDTLFLEAGNLTLGGGGYLTFQTGSVIKVDGGGMTLGAGTINNSNTYKVVYVGGNKTAGYELSGSGLNDVWLNLDDNTQSVTLSSDATINGDLHQNSGILNINGTTLMLMGDYMSVSGATLVGSSTSNLTIMGDAALSSNLMFDAANDDLNNFTVDNNGAVVLGSDLTVHGTLALTYGALNATTGHTLTMASGSQIIVGDGGLTLSGASFNGSASYDLTYTGSQSAVTGAEITGPGMQNLTIDMDNAPDSVQLMQDLTVNGTFHFMNGHLATNNHDINLKGSYDGTSHAWFSTHSGSDITIHTVTAMNDTLWFNSSSNYMGNLTINIVDGTYINIGNELYVENLALTNGGVTIWDDLQINSTGSITGANSNNYVMVMGDGYLNMNINNSAPYVMFPVGSDVSYSPVGIQQNSGTVGYFSVGTHNGVWSAGESGTNTALTQSLVNRTWDIEPVSASGSHNVNIIVQWDASMEVNGFDRTNSYISHYTSGAWDTQTSTAATSITGGMYQAQRMNITTFSPFAVVDNNTTLGLHEVAKTASIKLYPNPVNDYLNCIVTITEPTSVDLVNLTGEVVYSEKLNGKSGVINHTVDFSGLPNGIYFIRYNNSTGSTSYKIVKS